MSITPYHTILYQETQHIGTITLNRSDKYNAINNQMIAELSQLLQQINQTPMIRAVILAGTGSHFCVGADIHWMQQMMKSGHEENKKDALQLAHLLQTLANLSKPVIAAAQGRVMGGGIGLLACADIVIAAQHTTFCFSEVKLGLIPATIAPYIVRRIGDSQARRYFLTAELFDATEAQRLGLVHNIAAPTELLSTANQYAELIISNAPNAISAAKKLLNQLSPIDPALCEKTAVLLANIRSSSESQEGFDAFLSKRKPNWSLHD